MKKKIQILVFHMRNAIWNYHLLQFVQGTLHIDTLICPPILKIFSFHDYDFSLVMGPILGSARDRLEIDLF